MHERDHEGHIPPPDPPRKKRILGLQTHHLFGGLFLIAILLIYILLLARHDASVPSPVPPPTPTTQH
jgi:hypothetical protein